MAMTREQFDALVRRLEEYARREPAGYRLRVGFLAGLGYAYIFLVLAVLIAILAVLAVALTYGKASFAIGKIGFILGTLAIIILRALWVRMDPPDGLELKRAEAPALFRMVDELTTALQSPRFHHVLLTHEFNAAVMQVPRLGVLGWQRNYLLLGLPLMQALSPEQFRAVVAHELGHLSGNHSRFAGWIYRVRQTWFQLAERLEAERHPGTFIFRGFFNWYSPFFSAYSFVLARADEYVADRCAADLTSPATAAAALMNVKINARFLATAFWPRVYKQADHQAEPPAATFTALSGALRRGVPAGQAGEWLDQAFKEKTDNADTHPSLTDRLTALGYLPEPGRESHPSLADRLAALGYRPSAIGESAAQTPQGPASETAADRYLGDAASTFTARLELVWKQLIAPGWQERFQYAQESRQRLAELDEKAAREPLSEEDALHRARWTAEFRGNEAAIPLFEEFLEAHPENAPAQFAYGQILLEEKDERGIDPIEKAMARDPDAVLPGCQVIYAFLMEQGRNDNAERYRERAGHQIEQLAEAHQERAGISDKDQFEPHGLPSDAIERLREQLARYEPVRAAHLVRKVVTRFKEKPFYVLAVTPHSTWYKLRSETHDAELGSRLAQELEFPGEAIVIVLNSQTGRVGKAIRKVPLAQIYPR